MTADAKAKPEKPAPIPGTSCTPAQLRNGSKWIDVWVWAIVAGALTAQPQVVWSEPKAGSALRVSPLVTDQGELFRVSA